MSIVLYYLQPDPVYPVAEFFGITELGPVLARAEELRKQGCRHVSISSEHGDSVGAPGVASIEGGKTPDGEVYDWKKRRQ